MQIEGQTALVTGANNGFGRHLAQQLRDRGATVYAGVRNPGSVDLDGVKPAAIDVTDPASVAAAAQVTGDVSILINNAGSATGVSSLLTGDLADIRLEMDTHYFGTLSVTRAFAPQLGARGSSAVLNVLSVASWISFVEFGAYCAAKSAAWSLANTLRQELAPQGTRVSALHVAFMDTDMTRGADVPKADPADIAHIALDGIAVGLPEIIADDTTKSVLEQSVWRRRRALSAVRVAGGGVMYQILPGSQAVFPPTHLLRAVAVLPEVIADDAPRRSGCRNGCPRAGRTRSRPIPGRDPGGAARTPGRALPVQAALVPEMADPPGEATGPAPPPGKPVWPGEPLTHSETRVLRYLPTHMSVPEIAAELCLSANTVKTHLQHVYRKLGAHSRHEAVQRARAIGLFTQSSRGPGTPAGRTAQLFREEMMLSAGRCPPWRTWPPSTSRPSRIA